MRNTIDISGGVLHLAAAGDPVAMRRRLTALQGRAEQIEGALVGVERSVDELLRGLLAVDGRLSVDKPTLVGMCGWASDSARHARAALNMLRDVSTDALDLAEELERLKATPAHRPAIDGQEGPPPADPR